MRVDKKGNKIFTKRELLEKLNFTDEQADIVMQYQKKLPILLGEYEGFSFTPKGLQKLVVDGGKEKEPFIFSEVFEQFKEGE